MDQALYGSIRPRDRGYQSSTGAVTKGTRRLPALYSLIDIEDRKGTGSLLHSTPPLTQVMGRVMALKASIEPGDGKATGLQRLH